MVKTECLPISLFFEELRVRVVYRVAGKKQPNDKALVSEHSFFCWHGDRAPSWLGPRSGGVLDQDAVPTEPDVDGWTGTVYMRSHREDALPVRMFLKKNILTGWASV